jgi:hypothetical protein
MKKLVSAKTIKITLLGCAAIVSIYLPLMRLGYLPKPDVWLSLFCLNNCHVSTFHTPPSDTILVARDRPLQELILGTIDPERTSILIEKSKYRLTLYYRQQPIKSYSVVFGKNSIGDKTKEGDYKTPEGVLRIRDLYPHSSWSKFLWLDYPNNISWRKHFTAKLTGKIGLFDSVGSEVGIHGIARNSEYLIDEKSNWTWGCISLKNQAVDELYSVVKIGTIVEILP